MFLTVALTRVVPRIVSLLSMEGPDSRQLEPFELAMWQRIYGTLAIADREASVILHTILESVHPTNQTKTYHDSSLASMRPLSTEKTRETMELLTPEMHAMVVEANIKNHTSVPIQAAWKAALATASRQVSAESSIDQTIPTTVKEELPRTPSSLWDEGQPEDTDGLHGLSSRSRSTSPKFRREVLSGTKANDADLPNTHPTARSSSVLSAGEF